MKVIITLFIALMPCIGFSQDEAKEQGGKKRICRVLYLERSRNAPNIGHLFDGTKSHKVSLLGKNLSEELSLPTGKLSLSLTPGALANVADTPKNAPLLNVPEGVGNFYIIVTEDPDNKVFPVKMRLVDQAEHDFKLGQTLWVNMTEFKIVGKMGDKKLEIPPHTNVVGEAPLKASGYYKATFSYQPDKKGEYMPIMRKSWWFDEKSKNVGFITSTRGTLPKIYSFRDKSLKP